MSTASFSICVYKLLALAIGLLLTYLILRHPLLFDNYPRELNTLVPRETNVNKQIPHLHAKTKNLGFNELLNLGFTTLKPTDEKVLDYVRHTLLKDKDQSYDIKNDKITPLQKTMLVLGCYGGDLQEIHDLLPKAQPTSWSTTNPAIFYNFMLEAFDQFNSQKQINNKTFARPTHDKSICSCLRDFATPSLLTVENDKDDYNCSKYSYASTCSMQNLIDYTIDSSNQTISQTGFREKVVLPFPNPEWLRNQKDPFLDEIQAYENKLNAEFSNYNATNASISSLLTLATSGDSVTALKTFIGNYCMKVRYSKMDQIKCPEDWWQDKTTIKNTLLVKNVVTKMKLWSANMRTYNKVRNPYEQMTPVSFNNYIKKYKAGFEMCASFGIDSYSIEITGKTKYVHWYVIGELFLLLAAFLSFMWAREVNCAIKKPVDDKKAAVDATKSEDNCWDTMFEIIEKLLHVSMCVVIAGFIGLIVVFSGVYNLEIDKLEDGLDLSTTYTYFFTGFVSVFIVMGSVLALLVIVMFLMRSWSLSCFSCSCEKIFSCCNPKNFFNSDYAVVNEVDNDKSTDCKRQLFTAQIVQDLPVILGLTFMAVGTTLQRGVSNYNLILTVILLVTTTGLTTHITNVLRIMSLRFQGKMMTQTNAALTLTASMKKIQFNRVLIGLIIGFMLIVFLNLAGLDSVQGLEFASIHQTWFAIVAFVILVCGDLSLEFLAVFRKVFADEDHYLLHSVAKKSNNTGWLILISLCVLQLHSRHWLCPKYGIDYIEGNDIEKNPYCSNFF